MQHFISVFKNFCTDRAQFFGKGGDAQNRGFTLIELLVVIAIIGVLSSVVLASLKEARESSRDAARIEALRQVKIAMDLRFDDFRNYPGTVNEWYDMGCDGILNPDDGALYTDFSTIFGPPYMGQTPAPTTNVCMWYQPRNANQGYRVLFIPEQPKTLTVDQNCYNSAQWYCTGVNW